MHTFSRSISCRQKMFSGFLSSHRFIWSRTASSFQGDGSRFRKSFAMSTTICSGDFPLAPPEPLGWMSKMVFRTCCDCRLRYIMSAFECNPNTSGGSTSGYPSKNSLCFAYSSNTGRPYPE
eukprot:gene19131-biopygen19397